MAELVRYNYTDGNYDIVPSIDGVDTTAKLITDRKDNPERYKSQDGYAIARIGDFIYADTKEQIVIRKEKCHE